jgi:hypothetical protein
MCIAKGIAVAIDDLQFVSDRDRGGVDPCARLSVETSE